MRYFPFIIISLILYTLFFYNSQQPDLLSANNTSEKTSPDSKIVLLDFEKVAKKEQQQILLASASATTKTIVIPTPTTTPLPTIAITQKIIPIPVASLTQTSSSKLEPESIQKPAPKMQTAPEVEPVTTMTKKGREKEVITTKNKQQKQKLKQLQVSIQSMPASESALLKGELYERNFHLDLPPPPVQKRKPKKKDVKSKKIPTSTTAKKAQTSLSSQLLKQKNSTSKAKESTNSKPKRSFKKVVKPIAESAEEGLQEAIAVSGNTPNYPKKAKNEKLQGTVTVKFTVSVQGKSKKAQIVTSSGHKILDAAVMDFIEKERFMPSFNGIENVTKEQQFSFRFSIK
jgi:protein TonB